MYWPTFRPVLGFVGAQHCCAPVEKQSAICSQDLSIKVKLDIHSVSKELANRRVPVQSMKLNEHFSFASLAIQRRKRPRIDVEYYLIFTTTNRSLQILCSS